MTRGIAIYPGVPGSVHLTEVAPPEPGPREALVRVRRVGVCGTDRELIHGRFGRPPAGSEELVLGHEVLGVVEAIGSAVQSVNAGDLVAATVRRPDGCPACQAGQPDMCVWRQYTERGITGAHGFMVERFVEDERYLIPVPAPLEAVGVLVEPLSVVEKAARQADLIQGRIRSWRPATALVLGAGPIGLLGTMLLRARGMEVAVVARQPAPNPAAAIAEGCGARYVSVRETPLAELVAELPNLDLVLEATGNSALVIEAMGAVGANGVLVLLSITAGTEPLTVPADAINRAFVMGNKVMVGSVNSAREDFEAGVRRLGDFARLWPGLTERLITHRLRGFAEADGIAERATEGIKTVVELDG